MALNAVIEEVRPITTAIYEALKAGQKDVAVTKATEALALFKAKPIAIGILEKYTRRILLLGAETEDHEMMLTSKLIEGARELTPKHVDKEPIAYLMRKLERKDAVLKSSTRMHKKIEAARSEAHHSNSKWTEEAGDHNYNGPGRT